MKKKILYTIGWGSFEDAAAYAGVSKRTIKKWTEDGLKFVELNNKTKLIRFSDIDDYLNGFHPDDPATVKSMTNELFDKVVGQN